MKNFVTVTIAIFIFLTIGVESKKTSIDIDDTAKKLRRLAKLICQSDTVLYYVNGYLPFCKLSKKFICPETGNTPNAEAAKCIPTGRGPIIKAIMKVHKLVCLYEGNDAITKKVQALQQDGGQCIFHEFYGV